MFHRNLAVYLAGPIEKRCWRGSLVPGLSEAEGTSEGWAALSNGFPACPGLDYVGPFFAERCDHGCGHGPETHGYNPENMCAQEPARGRDWVAAQCLAAVQAADVLFAWIDRPDCHGTAVEIGHALAMGVGVAVGYPSCGRSSAAWFLGQAAALQDRERIFAGKFATAAEAFRELVVLRLNWFRKRAEARRPPV